MIAFRSSSVIPEKCGIKDDIGGAIGLPSRRLPVFNDCLICAALYLPSPVSGSGVRLRAYTLPTPFSSKGSSDPANRFLSEGPVPVIEWHSQQGATPRARYSPYLT